MSSLVQLQEQFQQFILTGKSDIAYSILSTKELSAAKRLAIYSDAYTFRLIECLLTNFPALHSYLGTEQFHILCRNFIQTHPSVYRSIRWYGNELADFVKTYYTASYAFLAELADFEWKMTLAFDAENATVVKVGEMGFVPPDAWPNLCFSIHPSVQRIDCFWNAVPLWQSLTEDHDLPKMNRDDEVKAWVLWRNPELVIQFYSLTQEEAWMFDGINRGLNFGDLCEGLCSWVEPQQVAITAASYLKNWIQKGIFSALYF